MVVPSSYRTGYRVVDAMTTRPITISPLATLQEAALLMHEHDVGSLIVKEKNELLGVLTEFDLVRKAIIQALDVTSTMVAAVMTRDMITVNPGMDIIDVLRLMRDANVRHVPVLENEKFVGFITLKDILKIQPQLIDLLVERYELREQERKLLHLGGEEEEY